MKRKFLAVLLSVALALTACPFAFATEAEFTPTPAPESTPAATESATDAPSTEPTQTATDAPSTEPTQTATDAPSIEPTQTATDAPSTEPTQTATDTPSTEPTQSTTDTPSTEPTQTATDAPTADPNALKLALAADKASVLLGGEKIELTLNVTGGKAPYSAVVTSAQGETVLHSETLTLSEAGDFVCGAESAPNAGTQTLTVVVTDADGNTATAKIELPVAEKIKEDLAATVRGIELTGDWAKDLIAIAESQLGYHESETSFRIDADGKTHGYTRYGMWYGNAYGEWCGMFVSFCLNYAGIPEADFPREANCNKWRSALKRIAVYEDDEDNYTPAPGDLIFFDITGETDDPTHVGIVTAVDNDKIYTIEGNQIRAVRKMEYKKDDKTIVGYANMAKIVARAAVKDQTAQPAETDYTAIAGRTGVLTGDKVNIRAEATTESAALGQTGVKGETVTLLEAVTKGEETWFKVEYGEIVGYIRSDFVFVEKAEAADEPVDEATDEPTNDLINVPAESELYTRIMACETLDEIWEIIDAAQEADFEALTEAENQAIEARIAALEPQPLPPVVLEETESEPPVESEIYYPTVNYTNVAPFREPVQG